MLKILLLRILLLKILQKLSFSLFLISLLPLACISPSDKKNSKVCFTVVTPSDVLPEAVPGDEVCSEPDGDFDEDGVINEFDGVGGLYAGDENKFSDKLEDTYLIHNVAQLKVIHSYQGGEGIDYWNKQKYRLMNDIDASLLNDIVPNGFIIASKKKPFEGELDGNGKTISNLVIDASLMNPNPEEVALFGALGGSATIKNLNFFNAKITGSSNTKSLAILVAYIDGNNVNIGKIIIDRDSEISMNTALKTPCVGGTFGIKASSTTVSDLDDIEDTINIKYNNSNFSMLGRRDNIAGAYNDFCSNDSDGDGVPNNDVDDVDNVDAFPTDACASVDTDGDEKPDSVIDPSASLADACTAATTLVPDPDDDDDGVDDLQDNFRTDSCASVDTDGDEKPDSLVPSCTTTLKEDKNDDNDGVDDVDEPGPGPGNTGILANSVDCSLSNPIGPLTQGQGPNEDYDQDGCQNDEDDDSDNDTIADAADTMCRFSSPAGAPNPTRTATDADPDSDGCKNSEDTDDDNDGVFDANEPGPGPGNTGILANSVDCSLSDPTGPLTQGQGTNEDYDEDGCQNNEDDDDDNDGVFDTQDGFDYDPCASLDEDGDGYPNTIIAVGDSSTDACTTPSGLTVDVDYDGDGLIEISTLDQLNAIRTDLDGNGRTDTIATPDPNLPGDAGCNTCTGYELTRDLVFQDDDPAYRTGAGWEPIGDSTNPFTGKFDGNNKEIQNLFIDRHSTDNVALFGSLSGGAEISNLGLTGVNITGNENVGGLVGYNDGAISHSYVTGTVTGNATNIGGLVGENRNSISNSYATGTVTGNATNIGGLVGENRNSISNSYATGTVTGNSTDPDDIHTIGGLVGFNDNATIINSYATGAVVASTYRNVGGLVGHNNNATISNSYATGAVTGNEQVGGLVGRNENDGIIESSYAIGNVNGRLIDTGGLIGYNRDSNSISHSYFADYEGGSNGIGDQDPFAAPLTTVSRKTIRELVFDMKETDTLIAGGLAWSPDDWEIGGFFGFPCLNNMPNGYTPQNCGIKGAGVDGNPYMITNYVELHALHVELDAWYKLANNIDASASHSEGGRGDGGSSACTPYKPYDPDDPDTFDPNTFDADALCKGWEPIGDSTNPFTGNFDGGDRENGRGYEIKNLFSYGGSGNSGDVHTGFFGYVSPTNGDTVTIRNIGLKDNFIIGGSSTSNSYTGGLVGSSGFGSLNISNSYATGSVTGGDVSTSHSYTGGLVGDAATSSLSISDSYATGEVRGGAASFSLTGGLVGDAAAVSLIISNSYARGDVHGGDATFNSYTGGLVGDAASASLSISNSYATGDVHGGDASTNHSYAGGLVGSYTYTSVNSSGSISNSYATGEVRGGDASTNHSYAGGLVGYAYASASSSLSISNSYARGEVHGGDATDSNTGGFVGDIHVYVDSSVIISNSYARGEVHGGDATDSNTGGFVGRALTRNSDYIGITNSYATGSVTGGTAVNSNTGGFVGSAIARASTHIDITYSYFVDSAGTDGIGARDNTNRTPMDTRDDGTITVTNVDQATGTDDATRIAWLKDLESPTGSSVHTTWTEGFDLNGDTNVNVGASGVDASSLYCDTNNDGTIDIDEAVSSNQIWDFGTANDLPMIHCTPKPKN